MSGLDLNFSALEPALEQSRKSPKKRTRFFILTIEEWQYIDFVKMFAIGGL